MDVLSKTAEILLEHIHLGDLDLLLHTELLTNFVNSFVVFYLIQVWYIATIKDVVDIFKLKFTNNLGVNKQE